MEKEKIRLGKFHKYEDGGVDRPFLTPDTVKEDTNDGEHDDWAFLRNSALLATRN